MNGLRFEILGLLTWRVGQIWGLLTIIGHFSEIALKEKDFYFEFELLGRSENVD